jgi:hypothetical protein
MQDFDLCFENGDIIIIISSSSSNSSGSSSSSSSSMCTAVRHKKIIKFISECYVFRYIFGESVISNGRGLCRIQGLLEWQLKCETFGCWSIKVR